jgi:hypothetical protein
MPPGVEKTKSPSGDAKDRIRAAAMPASCELTQRRASPEEPTGKRDSTFSGIANRGDTHVGEGADMQDQQWFVVTFADEYEPFVTAICAANETDAANEMLERVGAIVMDIDESCIRFVSVTKADLPVDLAELESQFLYLDSVYGPFTRLVHPVKEMFIKWASGQP